MNIGNGWGGCYDPWYSGWYGGWYGGWMILGFRSPARYWGYGPSFGFGWGWGWFLCRLLGARLGAGVRVIGDLVIGVAATGVAIRGHHHHHYQPNYYRNETGKTFFLCKQL